MRTTLALSIWRRLPAAVMVPLKALEVDACHGDAGPCALSNPRPPGQALLPGAEVAADCPGDGGGGGRYGGAPAVAVGILPDGEVDADCLGDGARGGAGDGGGGGDCLATCSETPRVQPFCAAPSR